MKKENKIIKNNNKAKSLDTVERERERERERGNLEKSKENASKINEKKKIWEKVKNKFQRDDAGRIIVPNRPAYAIIFLLILVIIGANIMLHRRTYADTGIEITVNTTEVRNGKTNLPSLNGVEAGPVEVTITFLQEGYERQYSIDNGKTWNTVNNRKAFVECTENKTIKARILNENSNIIAEKEYQVTNIDNEKPNDFDYTITCITTNQTKHFNNGENNEDVITSATVQLNITDAKDKGIATIDRWEYRLSADGGNSYGAWSKTTDTIVYISDLNFNKTYAIQIRAIDKAGNEKLSTYIKQFKLTKNVSYNLGKFGNGKKQANKYNVKSTDYKCSGCSEWLADIEKFNEGNSADGMTHYKDINGVPTRCGVYKFWKTESKSTRTPYLYKCSLCGYEVRGRKVSESNVDGATNGVHCWDRAETVSLNNLTQIDTSSRYSIEVVKLDEKGKGINNAKIVIGEQNHTTDVNGMIKLDNLTAVQENVSYVIEDIELQKKFTMTFSVQGNSIKVISNAKLTGANGDARIEIDDENKIIRVVIQPQEYKLKIINENAENGNKIEGAKYEVSIYNDEIEKTDIATEKTEVLKEGSNYITDNSGEMKFKGIEKEKTNKVIIKQVKAGEEYYEYESEALEIEIKVDENGNITNLEDIKNQVQEYGDKISKDSMIIEYDEENKTIKIIQKNVKRYKIKFINESTLGHTRIPDSENYIRLNYEDEQDRIEVGKTEVYEDANGESYYITDENGEINLGGIQKGANSTEVKTNHIYIQQKKENASYQADYVGISLSLDFEIDSSGKIVNEVNVKGQAKAQGDMIITDSFYININKETQTIEITMQNVPYITMGIKKTRVTKFGTKDLWVDDNGLNGARYKVTSYINGENVLEAESETETVEGIRGIAKATLGAGVNEIGIQEIGTGELAGDVDSKEYRIKYKIDVSGKLKITAIVKEGNITIRKEFSYLKTNEKGTKERWQTITKEIKEDGTLQSDNSKKPGTAYYNINNIYVNIQNIRIYVIGSEIKVLYKFTPYKKDTILNVDMQDQIRGIRLNEEEYKDTQGNIVEDEDIASSKTLYHYNQGFMKIFVLEQKFGNNIINENEIDATSGMQINKYKEKIKGGRGWPAGTKLWNLMYRYRVYGMGDFVKNKQTGEYTTANAVVHYKINTNTGRYVPPYSYSMYTFVLGTVKYAASVPQKYLADNISKKLSYKTITSGVNDVFIQYKKDGTPDNAIVIQKKKIGYRYDKNKKGTEVKRVQNKIAIVSTYEYDEEKRIFKTVGSIEQDKKMKNTETKQQEIGKIKTVAGIYPYNYKYAKGNDSKVKTQQPIEYEYDAIYENGKKTGYTEEKIQEVTRGEDGRVKSINRVAEIQDETGNKITEPSINIKEDGSIEIIENNIATNQSTVEIEESKDVEIKIIKVKSGTGDYLKIGQKYVSRRKGEEGYIQYEWDVKERKYKKTILETVPWLTRKNKQGNIITFRRGYNVGEYSYITYQTEAGGYIYGKNRQYWNSQPRHYWFFENPYIAVGNSYMIEEIQNGEQTTANVKQDQLDLNIKEKEYYRLVLINEDITDSEKIGGSVFDITEEAEDGTYMRYLQLKSAKNSKANKNKNMAGVVGKLVQVSRFSNTGVNDGRIEYVKGANGKFKLSKQLLNWNGVHEDKNGVFGKTVLQYRGLPLSGTGKVTLTIKQTKAGNGYKTLSDEVQVTFNRRLDSNGKLEIDQDSVEVSGATKESGIKVGIKVYGSDANTTNGCKIEEEGTAVGKKLTVLDTVQNTIELTVKQQPNARLVINKVDEEQNADGSYTPVSGMKFNVTEVNEDGTDSENKINNLTGEVTDEEGKITLIFNETTSAGIYHYYKIEEKGSKNTAYYEDNTPIYIRVKFYYSKTGKDGNELSIQDWNFVDYDENHKLTKIIAETKRASREEVTDEDKSIAIRITNEATAGKVKLNINKIDSKTKEKLKGAEFKVEVTNKKDENGLVQAEVIGQVYENIKANEEEGQEPKIALGIGEWEIKITETKAPEGYELLPNDIYITIKKDREGNISIVEEGCSDIIKEQKEQIEERLNNAEVNIEIENESKMKFELTKIDKITGQVIEGAKYKVIDMETNDEYEIEIGEGGLGTINWPSKGIGKHQFKLIETEEPEGYKKDESELIIEVEYGLQNEGTGELEDVYDDDDDDDEYACIYGENCECSLNCGCRQQVNEEGGEMPVCTEGCGCDKVDENEACQCECESCDGYTCNGCECEECICKNENSGDEGQDNDDDGEGDNEGEDDTQYMGEGNDEDDDDNGEDDKDEIECIYSEECTCSDECGCKNEEDGECTEKCGCDEEESDVQSEGEDIEIEYDDGAGEEDEDEGKYITKINRVRVKNVSVVQEGLGIQKEKITYDESKINITVSEERKSEGEYEIEIEKEDEEDEEIKLEGAKYEIYTEIEGEEYKVGEATTGEKGKAKIEKIIVPEVEQVYTYTLKEVEAPQGYEKGEDIKILVELEKVENVQGENTNTGSGTIQNNEEKNQTEEGKQEQNNTGSEQEVGGNEEGKTKEKTKVKIKECKIIQGDKIITPEIEENKLKIRVKDKLEEGKYNLVVEKVDSQTEEIFLANAKYKISSEEGLIEEKEVVTDEKGRINLTGLEIPQKAGTYSYIFEEEEAPIGYKKGGNIKVQITVEEIIEQEETSTDVNNPEQNNGQAEITNSESQATQIDPQTSEPKKTYKITKAEVIAGQAETVVGTEEEFVGVKIKDEEEYEDRYKLEIEKVDREDEEIKLEGAKYEIKVKAESGEEYMIKEITTNEEGKIKIEGMKGTGRTELEIKEINAPTGYKKEAEIYKVIYEKKETNGKIVIEGKVDEENKVPSEQQTGEKTEEESIEGSIEEKKEKIKVETTEEEQNIKITLTNEKEENKEKEGYTLKINKVAEENKNMRLKGAKYKISVRYTETKEDGSTEEKEYKIQEAIGETDKNGELVLTKVLVPEQEGTYTYKIEEIRAPEGYKIGEEAEIEVRVVRNVETGELEIESAEVTKNMETTEINEQRVKRLEINQTNKSTKDMYNIIITKKDSNGQVITDESTCEVKLEDNEKLVGATNNEGQIKIENIVVPEQEEEEKEYTYDLKELRSPKGYENLGEAKLKIKFEKTEENNEEKTIITEAKVEESEKWKVVSYTENTVNIETGTEQEEIYIKSEEYEIGYHLGKEETANGKEYIRYDKEYQKETLEEDGKNYADTYIRKIKSEYKRHEDLKGTTMKEFKERIETNADKIELYSEEGKLIDNGENKVYDEKLGTGMKVRFIKGQEEVELTLIVYGDVIGTGKFGTSTISYIQQYINDRNNRNEISKIEKEAIDLNFNGKIDFNDVSIYSMLILYSKLEETGVQW